MISATIIADSINPVNGARLTTMIARYPRIVHAEVLTHRMFSRNSASSRAMPEGKTTKDVQDDPFIPQRFPKNQPGMQGAGWLERDLATDAKNHWLDGRDRALQTSKQLFDLGVHKQIANRPMEPWMWMEVILSATDWENFFSLRVDWQAQPEFQRFAYLALKRYLASEPVIRKPGQGEDSWHIPFRDYCGPGCDVKSKLQISTARCARVSYMNQFKQISVEDDLKLFKRLLGDEGKTAGGHMSPFEHCAEAVESNTYCGNFRGWKQYRKHFKNENRKVDLHELLRKYEDSGSV